MKIRTRVAAIVLGTMAVGVVAATAVGTSVLSRGFEDIEANDAREDLAFAASLVDAEIGRVGVRGSILAQTSDARELLHDSEGHPWLDPRGIADELQVQQMHVLVVVDEDGHVVTGGSIGSDEQSVRAAPAQVVRALRPGGVLDALDDAGGSRGLIAVGDDVLVAASAAVSRQAGTGPPRGALLVGRWVDQALVQQWSTQVGGQLQFTEGRTIREVDANEALDVVRVEDDLVVAERVLLGIDGEAVALLSIRETRDIVEAGRLTLTILLVVVILTLGITAIVLTPAIDAVLLRRLRRLTDATSDVGASGSVSDRVEAEGKDEVTALARAINGMLASLERAQQEQELRNVELAEALEGKDRFVSTVAHELRTPITALKGLALTLMRADGRLDSDKQRELLGRLAERADSMEHLVDELLTMSRLAAGKVTATPVPVDLGAHVQALLEDLSTIMSEVDVDFAPDIVVIADPDHVSRIVINLLDNARRYGAPPFEIVTRQTGDVVELSVADHGRGISDDDVDRLFQTFEQRETSSAEGLGLGLSIVRSLAELNGGACRYADTPGGGATFVVALPAGTQQELVLHHHIATTSAGT